MGGIKIAMGIEGIDFSESKRYFNLILVEKKMELGGNSSLTELVLSPCEAEDWQDLGENFDLLFEVYGMSRMLCISSDENL